MKITNVIPYLLLILAVLPAACHSLCFLCRLLDLPGCRHHCKSRSSESSEEVSSTRPPTPTTTSVCNNGALNGQCVNQDGESIEAICRGLVYECACGDSPANDTMYDYCVNVIFGSQDVCRAIVTEGTNATPFTCVAKGDDSVAGYVCNQACNCCNLQCYDPDCYDKCLQSAAFHQMGETCAAARTS
ncbi:hypothetical protein Ddc_17476 [Ditylenchus destructor]|nr:hypothetical protein Ddc_17476 [Ditylenchus destructor]